MKKNERYLTRLTSFAGAMMKNGAAEQIGALCYRLGDEGSTEVLVITTRDSGRWTIPKGWPIKGLKSHQVAEREAWEEAGVVGKAKKRPLGYYTSLKTLNNGEKIPTVIEVHTLKVDEVHSTFPEVDQRKVEWLAPTEAALRVQEPELKGLLSSMLKMPIGPRL